MTTEEIMNLSADDVEKRLSEIETEERSLDSEVETSEDEARITEAISEKRKIMEERKALLERKAELDAIEKRKADAKALENGSVAPTKIIEQRKGIKEMPQIEIRDTLAYGKAFVKAIMTGDDKEARALLTDNVVGGTIPVPTLLDNEIRNAWEEAKLLGLCKQTSYPGNVKVGFEYSATGAVIHVEGTEAPEEEVLVLGTVELKAESIKKWITVSDEAIEGTTIDTLGYIYKEIAQKIAEKAEEVLVGKIVNAPAVSTTTACGVPEYPVAALAEDTIIMALAELSGKAKDINLAMNRRTYAAFKAVMAKAKYNVDVFDGLEEKVVFTDRLPAFSEAGSGDTFAIAGDFGYGAQVNRPSGNDMKIIVDEKSLAEKDLVKIVGKQYAGIGVVAPKAFVKMKKA